MLPGHLTKNFPSDIYVGSQNRKNTGNNHPIDKKPSSLHVQSSSKMVTFGAGQLSYRKISNFNATSEKQNRVFYVTSLMLNNNETVWLLTRLSKTKHTHHQTETSIMQTH